MPPPGTALPSNEGQSAAGIEELYYSNEDVAVLHEIVVLAQELLPKLPERERVPTNALFDAYFDVLPRLGIDAGHDSRYARVLFKIGGLQGEETLYDKFEEVLSGMGIEIQFGTPDEEEEVFGQLDDSQRHVDNWTTRTSLLQDETTESRRRRRRNSESSLWDLGYEAAAKYRDQRGSFSSDKDVDQRPEFLREIQNLRPSGSRPDHVDEAPREEEKQPDNFRAGINSPRRRRGRSVSAHASMRIRRRSHSPTQGQQTRGVQTSIHPPGGGTQSTSGVEGGTENSTSSFQGLELNQEPIGLVGIREPLALEHHLSFLARRQLRQWRDNAIQRREHHLSIDEIATNHDRSVLLRSSLATWQVRSLENRLARDTEIFYEHLERRAVKARDLFLMLKCLQQWSDYSREEVERTTVARRHIVKYRYFNAWAEITAVNELKVRRQVVKKFFGIWKKRYADISYDQGTAIQMYQSNVAEKVYWQWYHKLWDQRAKAWWAEGAKRRTMFRWIVKYHDTWEGYRYAEEDRRNQLVWNAWKTWRKRTTERARQEEQAVEYCRAKISRNAIRRWRKETQVIPARAMIQGDINLRIAREMFGIWLHRTRQERLAAATDRMKILREGLTTWRLKVRLQVLGPKVNGRIAGQAIYKWLLAERLIWFKKKRDTDLLRGALQHWAQRAYISRENRWQQEHIAEAYAIQKMQYAVLGNWYRQMQLRQERERDANALYAPRIQRSVILQWSERSRHYQQLHIWSQHAEFYFKSSRALKQWKAATEAAKREKRRVAYVQVKRLMKMNLARGILDNWRGKAQHVLDLKDQAHGISHNRIVVLGMNVFDQWRGRAEELGELESLGREYLLNKKFAIWKSRSSVYEALNTEGVLTYKENRGSRALKKWSLVTLQLRAQRNYATDIRERNTKKSLRKMFNYWHQKMALKRPRNITELDTIDPPLDLTARAEAWSDLEDDADNDEWVRGLDDVSASTPIPGYLSTPSKRSKRARTVTTRFSTTPKAPISTPFERQLRAQYSGSQLHSYRKSRGVGRSTLGMGGFEDIEEKSPQGA